MATRNRKAFLQAGTCVRLAGEKGAVLILGSSGSGKSDLALQLVYEGATLIADDQVVLAFHKNKLLASPPKTLKGLLEVRGVGIATIKYAKDIPVRLVVKLVDEPIERLPEPMFYTAESVCIPMILLHAFESSATAKIVIASRMLA